MQLSVQTLDILKNFSQINSGIWIEGGSTVNTLSPAKNMFAFATVKDAFPEPFGIYDLSEFLSVISFHKDGADLKFTHPDIIVTDSTGRSKIRYRTTDKKFIVTTDKKITFPEAEIKFKLDEKDFVWITNATKLLKSPNIAVSNRDGMLVLEAYNIKVDSAPIETLEICTSNTNVEYNMIFDTMDWEKLLPISYDVEISKRGIAFFKNTVREIEYYIGLREESVYK